MKNKNKYLFGDKFSKFITSIIPGSKEVSGGKEILCRCRYCPDSSDPNHAHMYIHIPDAPDDPALFHCFKCHASGIIDSKRLMEWGLYDPLIAMNLESINKKAKISGKLTGYDRIIYRFRNAIMDQELANQKLNYINSRLGLNLNLSDYMKDKVIFNLKDALSYNDIRNYTRYPNIVDQLNDYFIGFLSIDNNFVNLRRICDEGIVYNSIDKRYINYNIHDKKDNTEKFYVLPTKLDLSRMNKIQVHIAEGPMDILSIKYNVRNREPGLYCAIGGSAYKQIVMHLISTLKIFYFDLHIYPDNDNPGGYNIMRDIKEYVKPFGISTYIHRNTYPGEKDFGVPKTRIVESINFI